MNIRYFFKQGDDKSCGVCILLTLSEMYHRLRVVFSVKKGTSPKRIMHDLRGMGINAKIKYIGLRDITTLRHRLKPRSVIYYPRSRHNGKRGDHYVIIRAARSKKALIYDSTEEGPIWIFLTTLVEKWRGKNGKGWVIETWV